MWLCVCVKLWINVLSFFGYKREQNRKQWKRRHTHTHLRCGKGARLSWNVKGYHGTLQFKFYETFYCERNTHKKKVCRCSAVKRGSPPKIFGSKKENRRAKKQRQQEETTTLVIDCQMLCVSLYVCLILVPAAWFACDEERDFTLVLNLIWPLFVSVLRFWQLDTSFCHYLM